MDDWCCLGLSGSDTPAWGLDTLVLMSGISGLISGVSELCSGCRGGWPLKYQLIIIIVVHSFLRLYFSNCQLLDGLSWWFFHSYNIINLLPFRAIRFIKCHVTCYFNTPGGFVENMIAMSIWGITKKKTFINFRCKLRVLGLLVKNEALTSKTLK